MKMCMYTDPDTDRNTDADMNTDTVVEARTFILYCMLYMILTY